MTKLLEWLLGVSLIGVAWGLFTFDLLDLQLPPQCRELAWPMPVYLLVVFGCYSLATVGYRVATFNDCENAAKELQAQIKEAKEDLKKKGLKINNDYLKQKSSSEVPLIPFKLPKLLRGGQTVKRGADLQSEGQSSENTRSGCELRNQSAV
ncbi:hypothetical protein G5714_018884 [Onychostoma macrolepis]|uniref:Dolichol-phosphate mannosyltransferase subunit 3 n=1 Tax=Onychostoma macrolepis TaxID=369639 RepID=A0A7J6C082_9TELE|nr:hypothetical protein G5714_018884 [Onychostoma macrolepis]